ncbi:MAG: MFS transporter [Microvirga sp.]
MHQPQGPWLSGRGVGRLALGGCGTYRAGLMHPESPSPARMPWGFVAALSFAQLVSWGIVFYAFALFLEPMARELGWSKPALTLAYSLGLGASAATAYPSGRLIDKGHGRAVMTAGSLVSSALLVLWSRVDSYPLFVLIWIGLGATMSAILYEPGFAVLTHRLGPLSRRGITVMTLIGGLASTVFFPLSYALIEALGWRDALVALAAINLAVCGAIHFLVIPSEPARAPSGVSAAPGAAAPSSARRVLRHPAFWGFVIVSVLHNALFTGFAIHLVPLLVERGLTLGGAVAAFTLVGPAQVGGRIVIALGERAFSMRAVGLLACGLAVAAFLLLPFVRPEPWFVVVFALIYGAGNGIMTIVRAVLPAEIFGRLDYGAIQGMMNAPTMIARASAPFAFGALWAIGGSYDLVIWVSIAMAIASAIVFAALVLPSRT